MEIKNKYSLNPISKMAKFIIFDQAELMPPILRFKIVRVNVD